MSDPWKEWWAAKADSLRTAVITLRAKCEGCGTTEDISFAVEGWSDFAAELGVRYARAAAREKGWYYQSNRCLCVACRAVPPLKEKTFTYECGRCGTKGEVDGSYRLKRKRVLRPTCKVCGETDDLTGDFPRIRRIDPDGEIL